MELSLAPGQRKIETCKRVGWGEGGFLSPEGLQSHLVLLISKRPNTQA